MKVKIPIDAVTGETAKSCDIKQNPDHSDLPFADLPGSTWETLVVELSGFYFVGKYTWGVVKQLFKLQVAHPKAEWEKPCKSVPTLKKAGQIQAEYLKVVESYKFLLWFLLF